MAATDVTFDDFVDSLTGYDELAIKNATELPLSKLLETDEIHAIRAVIAMHKAREKAAGGTVTGKDYREQYLEVMRATLKEVRTYFPDKTDDDVIEDDPDSESGKDASLSERPTTT